MTNVLGPNKPLKSLEPENMVVAETLVPDTDDAVTAVNTGEPITPTIGLIAVPPVYALMPGATNVEGPNILFRSVAPE